MTKSGYCSECGAYVELLDDLSCASGHPRSSVRDVRDSSQVPASPPAASRAPRAAQGEGRDEMVSKIIGWSVIVVPVAIVFAIAVAITEPQFDKSMPTPVAWLASAGSVMLTIGLAFVWSRFRRRNR